MADQNSPKPNPNHGNHDNEYDYHYYKDTEGRITRIRKVSYKPRPGYIRLKFLQKYYIKYIRASYDSKLIWAPWIVGYIIIYFRLSICYMIYTTTMYFSQNELNR